MRVLKSRWWQNILIVCSTSIFVQGCAAKLSRSDFTTRIDTTDRPYVLDVRSKGEFRKGHVPGAVNINVFSLPFRMDEITVSKEEPIIVYCAHGPRAGLAGFFLKIGGFEKVYHLEGDMSGWVKAGMPLEYPSASEKAEGVDRDE